MPPPMATRIDLDRLFHSELDEHAEIVARTRAALAEPFARLVAVCVGAIEGLTRRREGRGEVLRHAGLLRALSREEQEH